MTKKKDYKLWKEQYLPASCQGRLQGESRDTRKNSGFHQLYEETKVMLVGVTRGDVGVGGNRVKLMDINTRSLLGMSIS